MAKHDIGKTIGELRKANGWTQAELAEKLNVSDKTVSKWEIGGGNPDVETLPSIADIFGVSLDYLMTGKDRDVKVEYVYTSRQEQCAKTDDVSLLDDLPSLTATDNNRRSLLDYVFEYESVEVFAELMRRNAASVTRAAGFDVVNVGGTDLPYLKGRTYSDFVRMCLFSGTVQYLGSSRWPNGIKSMMPEADRQDFYGRVPTRQVRAETHVLDDAVFDAIASDPRVSDETFEYLLAPVEHPKSGRNRYLWIYGLPYVLDKCYEKGQDERTERILSIVEEDNARSFEKYKATPRCEPGTDISARQMGYYCFSVKTERSDTYCFTRVLKQTVQLALARGDWKSVDRFSGINRLINGVRPGYGPRFDAYVPDDDALYAARVKNDGKLSDGEKAVLLCLHGGVLDVDELLGTDDYETIKDALGRYPIDIKERIDGLIEKGDWKELLNYAVDSGDEWLTDCAVLAYADGYKAALMRMLRNNGNDMQRQTWRRERRNPKDEVAAFDEDVRKIKARKETILDDYRLRRQYRDRTDGLSKDYFYGLIEKKDYEMAVIKLCVLLEAVLRNRFGYEGDLSDMMKRYCDEKVPDYSTRTMMNDLRKYRNGIVHPGESENLDIKNIGIDEIKRCVEYVCSLV